MAGEADRKGFFFSEFPYTIHIMCPFFMTEMGACKQKMLASTLLTNNWHLSSFF
jgi:hypothetical protein